LVEALEDRALPSATLSVPQWTAQGPGPILNDAFTAAFPDSRDTGAVESIAVASVPVTDQNPGGLLVYAGTVNGGVWRSDNFSEGEFGIGPVPSLPGPTLIQWRALTDQQASLGTTAMALDPADTSGNTLWVATGDFSSAGGLGANGVGLLRTTDGGQTWSNVGQSLAGSQVYGIAPTHVQVGSQIVAGAIVAVNGPGVEYSLNGGQKFQTATIAGTSTLLTGDATDVIADPNNTQNNTQRFYAAVTGGANQGVYRSDNGGQTWTRIDNGPLTTGLAGSTWIKLAVHFQNGKTTRLFVGVVGSNQNVSGVYQTNIAPAGSTTGWSSIGAGTGPGSLPSGISTKVFHFGLTADPVDANIVYVSGLTKAIYRGDATANGGKGSWSPLFTSTSFPHWDSRSLTFATDKLLLESDDGGVFGLGNPRNSSSGWRAASANMQATEFFSVSVDPTTGLIAGGTQDNGTPEQTSVGAVSWKEQASGDGGLTQFASDGTLYYFADLEFLRGSTGAQVLLASASSGTAYSGLNPTDRSNLKQTPPPDASFVYALNPANAKRLLVGLTGLYESSNQGDVVTQVTPTDAFGNSLLTGNVTAITYGVNNSDAAYVGTDTGQLWVRTTTGATFQQITTWPSTGVPVRIVVDPNDYRIAYVLDTNGKVWRTTDAGQTAGNWQDLTDNLDSLAPAATLVQYRDNGPYANTSPIQTIELYDPTPGSQPGDGVLLAGGLGGVFSLRLGSSDPCWHQLGTGLPNAVVSDLHYSPQQHVLVAGTFGRGAWTISNADSWLSGPTTLSVVADRQLTNNVIDIGPDPTNRSFLRVVEDGVVEYDGPYSYIAQVSVSATNPGDTVQLENLPACLPFVIHTTVGQGSNFIESETSGFPGHILVLSSGTTDSIYIGDSSQSLNANGTLNIQGDGVANVLVDDSGNLPVSNGSSVYLPNTQYTVGGGQLTRTAALLWAGGLFTDPKILGPFNATINYSGLAGLTIAGGPAGNYSYQVNSTAGANSVSIKAASMFDAVSVGDASHNLAAVGAVNVQGNGHTTVKVDDSGNLLVSNGSSVYLPNTQYTVIGGQLTRSVALFWAGGQPTDPQILGPFNATINYSGLAGLTIAGGPAGNYSYQVNSTAGANSVSIKAASMFDAVSVGDASHNLAAVGTVNVQGNGHTTVKVDDSGNLVVPYGSSVYLPNTQYTVGGGQLTRSVALFWAGGQPTDPQILGPFNATINYSGLAGLTIAGGPVGSYTYQVSDTTGMKSLALDGGAATSTFGLQGTSAGTSTTVNAGTSGDQINVGSAANTLDPITGLTINGTGHTTLTLNDQGAAVRENYLVYTGQIARGPITSPSTSQTQIVTYSGLASITLNGADISGNVFFALGTAAGTSLSLNAGSGGFNAFVATDEYNPSDTSPGTDQLLGPVAFHGHHTSDFGERYDYYDGAGHTFTLSAAGAVSTVQRDGAADLTYDGLSQMIVYVPKGGGNRLNVRSVAPGVYMNLTLSAGDQAVVGSLAPALGGTTANVLGSVQFGDEVPGVTSAVTVDDSGDTSTAARGVTIAPPPANPDDHLSSVLGLLGDPAQWVYWRLNAGSSVALRSGAGNTTFALQGFLPNTVLSIDGGGGVNTLDYSGWNGDIAVNLQRGTATGVDGGISNIRNVTGSIGNDLIVGDANVNVLIGGTGRNIIIGGGGADTLTGGGGDNILIGGTTSYDSDPTQAALARIMQEWLQSSSFADRMTAIENGTDQLAGTGFHFGPDTVFLDGLANITGGPGNNWMM
jgi:hypothetical protein